jgi:valyl-tRNA synthetase
MNIKPGVEVEVVLEEVPAECAALIADAADVILRLAHAKSLRVNEGAERRESATASLGCGVLHVPLAGAVDFAAELKRLDKEIGRAEADIAHIEKKLGREDFVRNAPAEVVAKDRRRLEEAREKRGLLGSSRARVQALVEGRG